MPVFKEEQQKKKLKEVQEREEEQLTRILADRYGLQYVDLSTVNIDLDYLKLVPEEKARSAKMAVFQGVGQKVQVGVNNPNLQITQNIIEELQGDEKGYQIELFLCSMRSLEKVWRRYREVPAFIELSRGIIDISSERIEEFITHTATIEKLKDFFLGRVVSRENRKISELAEIMLSGALGMEASDIHLEPQAGHVNLRLRLDGVLHDVLSYDHKAHQLLLSRIKLISEMKLNIKEKSQDGRFTIKASGVDVEVRASTLPGPYGESLVLRLLNPKTINVEFDELGMEPYFREIMSKEIIKPNGMILTTGPTGSGKTTTLYAFLKKIRTSEIKIITIEEPIEYHLENITQTQTNPSKNYTFATGLRSILRQDPDVIMVGEIRDLEAASIALNAALTGHLVFSTLHTNDAAGTIPRLIDLGANPAILAPAINISLAQRLVRKLCNNCKIPYPASDEEKALIGKYIKTFPPERERPDLTNLQLYKPGKCEKCTGIGFKGRTSIFEAILIDDKIENLILTKPSETEIKQISATQGILNMQQDAVLKITKGVTSIDETRRVIEL